MNKFKMPDGLNDVDANVYEGGSQGQRSCFLSDYGWPMKGPVGDDKVLRLIFKAWGVGDAYDIDLADGGRSREITNCSSRHYMLRFADGLWRFASFGGLNGAPMGHCELEGWPGKTGQEAHVRMLLDAQERNLAQAKAALDRELNSRNELSRRLAALV